MNGLFMLVKVLLGAGWRLTSVDGTPTTQHPDDHYMTFHSPDDAMIVDVFQHDYACILGRGDDGSYTVNDEVYFGTWHEVAEYVRRGCPVE